MNSLEKNPLFCSVGFWAGFGEGALVLDVSSISLTSVIGELAMGEGVAIVGVGVVRVWLASGVTAVFWIAGADIDLGTGKR